MRRLRSLVVMGALAVAVSTAVAGPAVAAKGGNSDNAHACQQGGHENRFEGETGNPFKNAGDCVSHGANGGAIAALQIATDTYPCGAATCWGTLSGSGLSPGGPWIVFNITAGVEIESGQVDVTGIVQPTQLLLPCGVALKVSARAQPVFTTAAVDSPCS